jgi:hypothetical protein
MILRRQADPSRELSARSEQLRLRGLHSQQHRTDRADARDLGETLASFIASVPGRELGIHLVDLDLQIDVFLGLDGKQFSSQDGQPLIGLDALEQRNQVGPSLGGSQAELGRIAAGAVGQLRAQAPGAASASPPDAGAANTKAARLARSGHRQAAAAAMPRGHRCSTCTGTSVPSRNTSPPTNISRRPG